MDRKTINTPRKIHLRNSSIKVLVPGRFSFIHAGHRALIQEIKSTFKNVEITVAIQDDQGPSVLTLQEKISTFKDWPEVALVVVIRAQPKPEDLDTWKIDFIATGNKNRFKDFDKVMRVEKKSEFSTNKIVAKIVKSFDEQVEKMVSKGIPRQNLGISKTHELSVRCKLKLKSIKNALWRSSSPAGLSSALAKTRNLMQANCLNYCEKTEKAVRSWLSLRSSNTRVLQKILTEIWHSA